MGIIIEFCCLDVIFQNFTTLLQVFPKQVSIVYVRRSKTLFAGVLQPLQHGQQSSPSSATQPASQQVHQQLQHQQLQHQQHREHSHHRHQQQHRSSPHYCIIEALGSHAGRCCYRCRIHHCILLTACAEAQETHSLSATQNVRLLKIDSISLAPVCQDDLIMNITESRPIETPRSKGCWRGSGIC